MRGSVGNSARREDESAQTKRSARDVCVEVVSRVQSKLSRALHAHRGRKLLQDLRLVESTTMKIAMAWFKNTGKGAKALGERLCRSLARRRDVVLPLEGDLRQEPGIA